jgi:hypothetical protein
LLAAPAALAELGGEVIEQFGMRRAGSHDAEIFRGFDEAGAEELLPDFVDGDAGGERVFRGDEPVGEIEAGGAGAFFFQGREEAGGVGFDGDAELFEVAADAEMGLLRLRRFQECVGLGQLRVGGFEFAEFLV